MKATAAQYAKTLHELTKDKNHKEIDVVISGFLKNIAKSGQMKIIGGVVRKYEEIFNQEHGIVEAEAISREKLNDQLVGRLSGFIKEKYSAKEVVLKNIVDENIKGGVIIKVGNEIMDGSLNRKLRDLKSTLEK